MDNSQPSKINSKPSAKSESTSSNDSPIDLSIFKQESSSNECSDYQTCLCVTRLLSTLKYYTLLKPHDNEQGKSILNEFMCNIYNTKILDDIHHLTHIHGQQIKEIMDYSMNKYKQQQCDLDQCKYSDRHYRVNGENRSESDKTYNFYIDTLDSLHFYINHMYHAGFRFYEKKTKYC